MKLLKNWFCCNMKNLADIYSSENNWCCVWASFFFLGGHTVDVVFMVIVVLVFLHKVVLTRACSTSALLATSPTLWPSWQGTTFPKTSVRTTDTQTLQTPVLWENPVLLFQAHNWHANVSGWAFNAATESIHCDLLYLFAPCCFHNHID